MVVNKCDMKNVDDNFISDDAMDNAFTYMKMDKMFKVSALTGENIKALIETVARLSLDKKRTRKGPCTLL